MNKNIIIGIVVVAVLVVGYLFLTAENRSENTKSENAQMQYENANEKMNDNSSKETQNKTGQEQALANEMRKISREEFAKHNSKDDCWVHFRGKVYDVTAWLSKHPGGADKIAQFCGKDGFEEAFIKKHKMGKVEKMYQETTYIGEFAK